MLNHHNSAKYKLYDHVYLRVMRVEDIFIRYYVSLFECVCVCTSGFYFITISEKLFIELRRIQEFK